MDGGCVAWHCLRAMWRWLFVDECITAASLLSLSFAVNSIFTGLSLSRFNLCEWQRRRARKFVESTLDDTFLNRIERLGRGNQKLAAKFGVYSRKVERFVNSMKKRASVWENVRRLVTVSCAAAAFACTAFEMKTRIGVALACPYVVILVCHAAWVFGWARIINGSRKALLKAKDEAEKKEMSVDDVASCANRLRGIRNALYTQDKAEKSRKAKPPARRRA